MAQAPVTNSPLAKLQAAKLDTVLARIDLPEPAAGLVAGCADPAAAFVLLEEKNLLVEAAKCAAHALPIREAVWWACMCARHTAPPTQKEAERGLVQTAEQWVRKPSEEGRRAAFAQAQAAGFTSPEAWAAVAAFWSGNSMSPPDQPKVPPPPDAAGRAVAGAIALAAVRDKPERYSERLKRFLQSARDIAGGGPGHLGPEEG